MGAFEIFRDNKKKEKTESDISEKYRKLSVRFAVLKWISLTVLVIYVIVSVSLHGDELSFDSIRYIVRYMKEDPVSLISNGDSIAFDYDSQNKAYIIGDDFAIVGSNGVTIYDFSGKILFSDNYIYDEPAAVSNGNELIVYNIGGKEARFYNSYSLVNRMTFESPVYHISVAENGNYLIQTSSDGYRSGFRIYDNSRDLVFRNNYGELTLQSSSLSPAGDFVVSSTFSTFGKQISLSVFLYDISKPKHVFEFNIEGEYPVFIQYVNEETIVLFTDKSIRFFNSNLDNTYSYYYGKRSPLSYNITSGNVIVTYTNSLLNEKTEIEIISDNGSQLNSIFTDSSILDICVDDDTLYLLQNGTIKVYSLTTKDFVSSYDLSDGYSSIIKIDKNKYLLSRSDKVEMYISD